MDRFCGGLQARRAVFGCGTNAQNGLHPIESARHDTTRLYSEFGQGNLENIMKAYKGGGVGDFAVFFVHLDPNSVPK